MEINGRSTKDMTHADAIELIKQCGSSVSLLVKRGGKLPQHLGECWPFMFMYDHEKLAADIFKILNAEDLFKRQAQIGDAYTSEGCIKIFQIR